MKFIAGISFLVLFTAVAGAGQDRCLTKDEAAKVIESMNSTAVPAENKPLRDELLKMQAERDKLNEKVVSDSVKNQAVVPTVNEVASKHLFRVCQLLRETGWISRATVGTDGFDALIFIISNNREVKAQQQLLPVLIEGGKKGLVKSAVLAWIVDSIRVGYGLPQIFGTQAVVVNNVVYVQPLANPEKVDEWRKVYELPPLSDQMRVVEGRYMMPVVVAPRLSVPPKTANKDTTSVETTLPGISDEDDTPLKVDTKLVNLNASVLAKNGKSVAGPFTRGDFELFENGVKQEISFFSTTDQPLDLVLLLDFSGSTYAKRGLMKKAAKRFVEVARPVDRISIVAFSSAPTVFSPLTNDKSALTKSIDKIDLTGGSAIWDSLRFVYEKVLADKGTSRRSAVIFMTDGIDSSLKTTFSDSMETVRRAETTVFPIYFGETRGFNKEYDRFIEKSQRMLRLLAEESGGQYYGANDVKDLVSIYEQIAGELGQLYSIGYEPTNENRDGGWRSVMVKIKSQPDLVVRTRRGYYAK